MKKLLSLVIAWLLTITVFAGCAPADTPAPPVAPEPTPSLTPEDSLLQAPNEQGDYESVQILAETEQEIQEALTVPNEPRFSGAFSVVVGEVLIRDEYRQLVRGENGEPIRHIPDTPVTFTIEYAFTQPNFEIIEELANGDVLWTVKNPVVGTLRIHRDILDEHIDFREHPMPSFFPVFDTTNMPSTNPYEIVQSLVLTDPSQAGRSPPSIMQLWIGSRDNATPLENPIFMDTVSWALSVNSDYFQSMVRSSMMEQFGSINELWDWISNEHVAELYMTVFDWVHQSSREWFEFYTSTTTYIVTMGIGDPSSSLYQHNRGIEIGRIAGGRTIIKFLELE